MLEVLLLTFAELNSIQSQAILIAFIQYTYCVSKKCSKHILNRIKTILNNWVRLWARHELGRFMIVDILLFHQLSYLSRSLDQV